MKSKIKKPPFFYLISLLSLLSLLSGFSVAQQPSKSEATITSDELEMKNNGEETFFRGHVVLTQVPYLLNSDEMTRIKTTGITHAYGHIDATWLSDKDEKIKGYGDEGFYDPNPPKTELWGTRPNLYRWETSKDTEPVHIIADHFIAYHHEREFYGLGHVIITKSTKVLTRSDKAKYDQKEQVIHLYGPTRIFVHIADAKGDGDFWGDKGWVTLEPKTAHMEGHVIGHVNPG